MKAYVNFIAAYGKQYGTKVKTSQKYEVFKKNYEKIQEHNANVKSAPFVMEVNKFADMTTEEFFALLGAEVPYVLEAKTAGTFVKSEEPKHHHHHHHHQ
jgi:hypothetical protein